MKKLCLFSLLILATLSVKAQNFDELLTAGEENAARFANDYLAPATNGLIHSMNANWFNTADAKPLGGFEISIITNAAIYKDKHQSFLMNIADYNSNPNQDYTVAFADGASSKMVSTALGENNPAVDIEVTYTDSNTGISRTETITLPDGIGNSTGKLLPTAFIQGAVGLIKGIEVKARFLPSIKTKDTDISMYGAGLQMEFTKWLPADKLLPVAISGLVAYTHLNGKYDITESSGINGDNQRLETGTNTLLLELIASTKLPVFNVYGGLGYLSGKSNTDLLGTYTFSDPILGTPRSSTDPFSVASKVSNVRGTIGAKLKLSVFRINAEYHISDFDAVSVGIHFGFR